MLHDIVPEYLDKRDERLLPRPFVRKGPSGSTVPSLRHAGGQADDDAGRVTAGRELPGQSRIVVTVRMLGHVNLVRRERRGEELRHVNDSY